MKQTMCGAPQCACPTEAAPEACEREQIVSAGEVCEADCAGFDASADYGHVGIQIHPQVYRAGFCPAEALRMGTLFPELVSPYTRGC